MDQVTFVNCYKKSQASKARTVAEHFRSDGYNVRWIDGVDILICDDFSSDPKACNSGGEFDYIVVVASKKPIDVFVPPA